MDELYGEECAVMDIRYSTSESVVIKFWLLYYDFSADSFRRSSLSLGRARPCRRLIK